MTIARIIKAANFREALVRPTYNFVDLQHEADDVMTQARCEAERILSEARSQVEELFAQTRMSAKESASREAEERARQRLDEVTSQRVDVQLETALPALHAAAAALQAERDRWLIRWEQTAVQVGVAIAGKLLKTQINARPELATGMITEALRLAAGQPRVSVHLNPDDLAAWGDRAPRIVESLTACADSTLIPDSGIARGGCRIQTIHGEIDARVETMLERMAEELLEE